MSNSSGRTDRNERQRWFLANRDRVTCTFSAIVETACPTCAALDWTVIAIGTPEWERHERMEHGCERPTGDQDDPCGCGCNLVYVTKG